MKIDNASVVHRTCDAVSIRLPPLLLNGGNCSPVKDKADCPARVSEQDLTFVRVHQDVTPQVIEPVSLIVTVNSATAPACSGVS